MMGQCHIAWFGVSDGGYQVNAVDFDGTNDYLNKASGFTGASDSKTGIFSGWFRFDGGDGSNQIILNDTNLGNITIFKNGGNKFQFNLGQAGGSNAVRLISNTALTASATWGHILASWDAATSTGHLYLNSVSDLSSSLFSNANIDYTLSSWRVGANSIAGQKFNGCMSELYFAPGQYLDFSAQANREKFILGGKPVNLGLSGSLPTGTSPILYLKGDAAGFEIGRAHV